MVRLVPLSLASDAARALERDMSAEIVVRYGGEEFEPPLDASSFEPPDGAFLVAELEVDGGDWMAVGCAGIRRHSPTSAELKRMFVATEARGRGIARSLLVRLEDEARDLGYTELRLETGTAQPEAIALYESCGYVAIPNYGQYADDPRSRCYAKAL
ncbi:MAG: GNAT family N-acetyltransferase [Actinomycetota bacterium]|nr:GNAT family N-acetyltransferase [Actinomycetota bacterium]